MKTSRYCFFLRAIHFKEYFNLWVLNDLIQTNNLCDKLFNLIISKTNTQKYGKREKNKNGWEARKEEEVAMREIQ